MSKRTIIKYVGGDRDGEVLDSINDEGPKPKVAELVKMLEGAPVGMGYADASVMAADAVRLDGPKGISSPHYYEVTDRQESEEFLTITMTYAGSDPRGPRFTRQRAPYHKATVHWPEGKIFAAFPADEQPTIPKDADVKVSWDPVKARFEIEGCVFNGVYHPLVNDPSKFPPPTRSTGFDREKWLKFLERCFGLILDSHHRAIAAGAVDPVVVVIHPLEGGARQFSLAHGMTETGIDQMIAHAGPKQRAIQQIVFERTELEKVLPAGVRLGPVDHSREFWVVVMDGDEVMSQLFERRQPDVN